MQNASTMKSGEEAPMPAAVNGEAAAPEPGTASEAAVVVMAPEPAAMREVEPVEEDKAPQPGPVIEAATATEDAPQQQGAEVVSKSRPAGIDGVKSPTSPAPLSPSQVKERQISVDPASLRRLGMVADEDSPLSAPSVFTEVVVQSPLLPPLRRPTFVGASLPCSAASSPVHGTGANRWEDNQTTPSPRSALSSLARQHSAALARLVVAAPPAALSRSASRAEGRTMAPHDDDEEEEEEEEHVKALASEEGFTCGALCMLIPGFSSRKKPAAAAVSNIQRQHSGGKPRRSVASRVASLERFECGSWSPPPPPMPQHTAAVARHSSDCHEVAKISCDAVDDTESPVKMAFVFDGGEAPTPRGILKNSASASARMSSSARPSTSSQRHVRFSTAGAGAAESCPSSPSGVVTPRLARARAEFNAFLEAQSAA